MKNISSYGIKILDQIRALSIRNIACDEIIRKSFQILRAEIAFDSALFLFYEDKTHQVTGTILENMESKYLRPLLRNMDSEPKMVWEMTRHATVIRGSDLWSRPSFMASPLYQKVLRPNGLYFSLIGSVYGPKKECIAQYWFWKREGLPNFSKQAVYLAAELSPIFGELLSKNIGVLDSGKDSMVEIARKRSHPGIVIYDTSKQIIYQNSEAAEIEDIVNGGPNSGSVLTRRPPVLFEDICNNLKMQIDRKRDRNMIMEVPDFMEVFSFGGESFCFRALLLEHRSDRTRPLYVILIDRITKDKMEISRILTRFHFSPREIAVVRLISIGKTNKEIAQEIGVGEHTVKDHVRRIMNRIGVTTRTGIVSTVFGLNTMSFHGQKLNLAQHVYQH